MSHDTLKIYEIEQIIDVNIQLRSLLDEDVCICDIEFDENKDFEISSPLKDLIKSIDSKESIKEVLICKKNSLFSLPLVIRKLSNEKQFNMPSFNIIWSQANAIQAEISNSFPHQIPKVEFIKFDLGLRYEAPKKVIGKQSFEFNIFIENKTNEFKRLMLLIDHEDCSFAFTGPLKKKIISGPYSNSRICYTLTPYRYGMIKVPSFKIMEYSLVGGSYEHKKYSIYHTPESVSIIGILN